MTTRSTDDDRGETDERAQPAREVEVVDPEYTYDEHVGKQSARVGDVVVCGVGRWSRIVANEHFPYATAQTPVAVTTAHHGSIAAAFVVVDPDTLRSDSASTDGTAESTAILHDLREVDTFVVGILPAGCSVEAMTELAEFVDAVMLIETGGAREFDQHPAAEDQVVHGVETVLEVVQAPGFVNVDLMDAKTVLESGLAALSTGVAPRSDPEVAVAAAFDGLPAGVETATASAVLVDVIVDGTTSITAATDAIAAVRSRIAADANIIWGGSVDESATDEIAVRIVVADVAYKPQLSGGDPCPRCGAALSVYVFGSRETLSCDACGYSGITVSDDGS